jgi:SlyX protein
MTDDVAQKLIDLEIRLAEQEVTIDSLSETVYRQWQTIDKLTKQHDRLSDRFTAIEEDLEGAGSEDGPPPHY